MPPVLVDLYCNDLEVGKSITMSEVGPTSAYLEHDKPLPVGAELRLHGDEGAEIGAVVVRIFEKISDAERAAGMYVRVVEIEGDGESWWRKHLDSDEDPVFPLRAVSAAPVKPATARTNTVDITPEEIARMSAEDRTEANAAVPFPGPPPVDESAPNAKRRTPPAGVHATLEMSADHVRSTTDAAPPEARNGTSMGMAVAAPPPEIADPAGKKKKRRGRKKKS